MLTRVLSSGLCVGLCVGLLAGCARPGPTADLAGISAVTTSFGPQFTVTEVAPTGIDPALLAGQPLPDGLRFDPPGCARLATARPVPPGTEGNMAAVSAEGEGNRFIVFAVETSVPIPVDKPESGCTRVAFAGDTVRGTVEQVQAPEIDGAQTLGVHRVVQTMVEGSARTGELYSYSAHFGDYQVIVSANPLVVPGTPVRPVDTRRARDLLVAGVNAVRR